MKSFIVSAILSLLTFNSINAVIHNTQKRYIRFSEHAVESPSTVFENKSIPSKSKRLSNKQGEIILTFDSSLPDSIQIAFAAAKKLWESHIQTVQPIYISILFESLDENIPMAAEVSHVGTSGLLGCPCALASQLSNSILSSPDDPDGYIILNSNFKWSCSFSKPNFSSFNLPTMILRGIARCLGFGSSIIEDYDNVFSYYFDWPTYFDNLLVTDEISLTQLNPKSNEMTSFVTSNNVFANIGIHNKVYAPTNYIRDLSLCCFDDTNSLMSNTLGLGDINFAIDEKTSNVLKFMGWNFNLPGVQIKCNDISDNGIGSAYTSHTFSLSDKPAGITAYNWKYYLKDQRENYVIVSSGNSEEFSISGLTSTHDYFVNINGDLEGRIECEYILNGNPNIAIPFSLSLELKPSIISIDNITVHDTDTYKFSLQFDVVYTGAEYLSVEIEEEYNTSLRSYRFDEPYIAHVIIGDITNLYYSWITIIASNAYGTTYRTLEYPPGITSTIVNKIQNYSINDQNITQVRILNVDGTTLFVGKPAELQKQIIPPGLYFKQEIYDNGELITSKLLIK